ncbi:hypothetical protein [Mesorhizobium sp. KR9-304]|uniref:hypothetical protein n=1 Tax=Mesorhizobium sp. KR9-304 TaxID=3156614 RepID=UPI0032B380A7
MSAQQAVSKSFAQHRGIYARIDFFYESSDRFQVACRLRPIPQGAKDKVETQS